MEKCLRLTSSATLSPREASNGHNDERGYAEHAETADKARIAPLGATLLR